ncbi:MAG: hypothetical protein GY797_33350, partial [Deltaproteobacteria bacterium]|nr:hypothetical protein [Deltaproteobacteria bacterium]
MIIYHGKLFRLLTLISGPLRDPLIAAGCFAIDLRGSALRAPPIRPMEPTAILSTRQKFYEFSPDACDSRGSSGGVSTTSKGDIMNQRKIFRTSILVVCLMFLGGCTNISIRTAIEIDAPKEEVYAVLADIESYPEWNPYHRKVEGKFVEGAALTIYVLRPDGKEVEVPPHMMRIIENEEITWGGGIRG